MSGWSNIHDRKFTPYHHAVTAQFRIYIYETCVPLECDVAKCERELSPGKTSFVISLN